MARHATSALLNPNDKRRINKLARISFQEGLSPKEVVSMWLSEKHIPKKKRSPMFQRDLSLAGAIKAGKGKFDFGQLAETTETGRSELGKLKRLVSKEFEKQGKGYGRSTRHLFGKGGRLRTRSKSYASRVGGTHASRYYLKKKRTLNKRGQVIMSRPVVKAWGKTRQSRRAAGDWGHTFPKGMLAWEKAHNRYARGQGVAFPYGKGGKSSGRSAAAKKGWETRRRAAGNPRHSRSALRNPTMIRGFTNYLEMITPVVVGGALAGGVHFFLNAGPGQLGLKVNELVDRIPFIGVPITTYIPNTFQGAVFGGALGIVAARTRGKTRTYLNTTAGLLVAAGAFLDTLNFASAAYGGGNGGENGDLGALALDNMGALALDNMGALALDNMGALALDNMGALALDNFGDGMAYETAPLAAQEYGQATLGDAYYSGADFSVEEGQALLNGSQGWMHRFGRPTRRTKKEAGSASHMAGMRGHRWGWLIKMVGYNRAASIASMAPKKRLRVLKALRQGAIQGFQRATLLDRARAVEAATPPIEELVAKTSAAGSGQVGPGGPCGPMGAAGASDLGYAYGDPAVFMGE